MPTGWQKPEDVGWFLKTLLSDLFSEEDELTREDLSGGVVDYGALRERKERPRMTVEPLTMPQKPDEMPTERTAEAVPQQVQAPVAPREEPTSPMYTMTESGEYDFSRPDAGISMEAVGADKLKRIRDQAAAKFPGATGGMFVSAEMTPEIAQRLKENEEYAAGHELRMAKDNLVSQYGKGQEEPARAANALSYLMQQEQVGIKQRLDDARLDQLYNSYPNKVPFDVISRMDPELASQVPMGMIGRNREEVSFEVERYLHGLRAKMADIMATPQEKETARLTLLKLQKVKQMVDPDQMKRQLDAIIMEADKYYNDISFAEGGIQGGQEIQ